MPRLFSCTIWRLENGEMHSYLTSVRPALFLIFQYKVWSFKLYGLIASLYIYLLHLCEGKKLFVLFKNLYLNLLNILSFKLVHVGD